MSAPAISRSERVSRVFAVDRQAVLASAVALVALFVWALSLQGVDLGRIDDFGLISALPLATTLSMVALTVSFGLAVLGARPNRFVLALHVAVLLLMVYGLPSIVEPLPRFSVAWRHVGIAEVLTRTGGIDPSVSAYFSWPGFFALAGLVSTTMGWQDTMPLVGWSPLAFNVLYLAPVGILAQSLVADRRVRWLAVWLFLSTNWIGQDYFSPQAFGFLIYLWILALLIRFFGREPTSSWPVPAKWLQPDVPPVEISRPQRAGLLAIISVLFFVLVASHQLTPFATLASIVVLVATGRISTVTMPALMAVLLGAWLSYMTVTYLAGNLNQLLESIGSVDSSVSASLTDRLQGSPQHVFVAVLRSLVAVALWSIAVVGVLLRFQIGRRDVTMALLAFIPFGLLALQSYGGEILLRIFLFSLPFMALLAAHALEITASGRLTRVMVVAVLVVFMGGSFVSRYGNERMDIVTADQIAATDALYEIAEPGSLLVVAGDNTFWQYRDFELHRYRKLDREVVAGDVDGAIDRIAGEDRPVYVILSDSQFRGLALLKGVTEREWAAFERRFAADPRVERIYDQPAARIYRFVPGGS
ncbi:MAG: hypothetical protein K5924_06405 [Chloroflexi bacterium]|nr:hypothetical protein [Chloroflexota bacterium]